MKKTFLKITVLLVISIMLFVSCSLFDSPEKKKEEDEETTYSKYTDVIAAIGTTTYTSLQDAVDHAEDGDTVKLLCNVRGLGVNFPDKTVTLDLGGFTYTFEKVEIGEKSSEIRDQNGFVISSGNITITNGKLAGSKSMVYPLVNIAFADGTVTITSSTDIRSYENSKALAVNGKAYIDTSEIYGTVEMGKESYAYFKERPEHILFDVEYQYMMIAEDGRYVFKNSDSEHQNAFRTCFDTLESDLDSEFPIRPSYKGAAYIDYTIDYPTPETVVEPNFAKFFEICNKYKVTSIRYNLKDYAFSDESQCYINGEDHLEEAIVKDFFEGLKGFDMVSVGRYEQKLVLFFTYDGVEYSVTVTVVDRI